MAISIEGFENRLSRALQDAGITQSKLAELMGASQPAVSQWVSGKKLPTEENLLLIARFTGANLQWLESGVGTIRAVDAELQRSTYLEDALWAFRAAPQDGGRDYGNANVWSFDPTLAALVRDVLQNCKDAALTSSTPVNVIFRIIRLAGDDLRAYQKAINWEPLQSHLKASTKNAQKLGRLIQDGLDQIRQGDELLLLCIEDSGTTGLIGPEKDSGKFTALCRNNLDSNKEGAGTKGGAFGLGKAVLWRASRLSTVIFCSHLSRLEDGLSENRIIGRCDLPWHKLDDGGEQCFAGPGWFGHKSELGDAVSFWENETLAKDLYLERQGTGTTACVVGFHDASADEDRKPVELAREIVQATAEHFFPAIVFEHLKVRVEVYENRDQYIQRRPSFGQDVSVEELQPRYCKMLQAYRDGTTAEKIGDNGEIAIRTIPMKVPRRNIEKKHGEFDHEAILLVAGAGDDAHEHTNTLAMFRGPGMVVQSESLTGLCLGARPFFALLLCGKAPELATGVARDPQADAAGDEFLRTAEPPSHNKWEGTPDLRATYAHGCISRLKEFLVRVKEAVRDVVRPDPKDLGDGPQAMRELFRLGTDPVPQERPRVVWQRGKVEDGRWNVEARVRLKARKSHLRLLPAVFFLAETGSGQPVAWAGLEPVLGCSLDEGFSLLVPPDTREVRFRGTTDPKTHPVPAAHSCVVVDIRKVLAAKGGIR
jgi:transcriptional regulator with XRE-family HTH domain